MNIQHFINARKQAGLSQSELAEGICTQTTLSRFENNGQVPSLKILIQLCNRLSLPIGELFPKVGVKQPELSAKMDQAEFYLITSEHEQLAEILASIPVDTIEDHASLFRYYYLQGFVMIFQKASITDILFTFDKLLLMEKQHSNPIFRLLALTGSGMAYSREGDDEKAEFYFEQVFEEIYTYPIKTIEDTWRVLNIVFHCGEFYGERAELATSNALLDYALTICSDNHVTYYLARAAYQLAVNALAEARPKNEVSELLADAKAYAKINRNRILLNKIANLQITLDETN